MGVQTRLRAPMGGAAVVAVSTLCLPAVVATPPLLPPGPRLRDLAASRSPPLLFGTDLVDSCPMPLTGNPRGCGPSAAAANASTQPSLYPSSKLDRIRLSTSALDTGATWFFDFCASTIVSALKSSKRDEPAIMTLPLLALRSNCEALPLFRPVVRRLGFVNVRRDLHRNSRR